MTKNISRERCKNVLRGFHDKNTAEIPSNLVGFTCIFYENRQLNEDFLGASGIIAPNHGTLYRLGGGGKLSIS